MAETTPQSQQQGLLARLTERVAFAWYEATGLIGGMGVLGDDGTTPIPTTIVRELPIHETETGRVLRIKVYSPLEDDTKGDKRRQRPCLLVIEGSAFYGRRFDKDDPPPQLKLTADKGWVLVVIEHRGSGEGGTFPVALHDVAAAVRYVRARADDLNVDPLRLAISGDSSGAWCASMIGLLGALKRGDDDASTLLGNLGPRPDVSAAVTCVVALFPPTQFDVMDEQILKYHHEQEASSSSSASHSSWGLSTGSFLGSAQRHDDALSPESRFLGVPVSSPEGRALCARASPATYVTANAPPFFLAHGADDPLVPVGQSKLLYDALVEAASSLSKGTTTTSTRQPDRHHYLVLERAGHATHHFSRDKHLYDRISAFLDQHNGLFKKGPS